MRGIAVVLVIGFVAAAKVSLNIISMHNQFNILNSNANNNFKKINFRLA